MNNPAMRILFLPGAVALVGLLMAGPLWAQTKRATVESRVAKLERALDNRGLLDMLQQIENLQQEVQRLRGQIEEQTYTIDQLRKTQRDTYVDLDQRLRVLSGGGATGIAMTDETGDPPLTTIVPGQADAIAGTASPSSLQMQESPDTAAAGQLPAAPVPGDQVSDGLPQPTVSDVDTPVSVVGRPSIAPRGPTVDNEASEIAYRDAFSLLKAGQYDDSIAAFSDFLTQFPDSQYGDNAQYWLGETYYVKREFELALVEYRKLIENYPASKKRSHAMLKIGYSYYELGQLDQARAVLEDLRSRYPGTTAARLAEERIHILADATARP